MIVSTTDRVQTVDEVVAAGSGGEVRAAAHQVFVEEGIELAYLFGSRARGDARPDSDVDVAVLVDAGRPCPDPARLLARHLHLAARLHDAGAGEVDLVLLDDAPLALRGRVAREGRPLYVRDDGVRAEWESRTSREFFDFEIFMAPLEAELLAAHAQGRR